MDAYASFGSSLTTRFASTYVHINASKRYPRLIHQLSCVLHDFGSFRSPRFFPSHDPVNVDLKLSAAQLLAVVVPQP